MIPEVSERALVLAPVGRDADIAARMLGEAGIRAVVCPDLAALVHGLEAGAGFAVLTEEALDGVDARGLAAWLGAQPEWSDFPFVLLTKRGGGLERNPAAARHLRMLGNVAFVERPFHPTTLVSLAESALRGRRRQYEARGRLAELVGLADALERRVEERTREREAAQDALRQAQKMEAIGQLTGGVAHDFNNLLTVIRGSVSLLQRPGLSEDKRARFLEAIASTADRAAKLTSQLLAFARRQALTPERFDAGASVREVAGIVRTLAGSRVELRLELGDAPVFTLADRGQFDTAIVNMAINARDAMGGEGVLTIRADPVREGGQDFIAFEVADTGCGIAAEDLGRIFEPFFTTKPVGEGTGLGLSQVIGFAKQSGGDVRVRSRPGEGTVFTMLLPRVAAAEPRPGLVADGAVDGAGTCVLVVEDNAEVGEFAVQALRALGYDSVLAGDGPQALRELEAGCDRFHVVFSDVVMPGMSGVELGREVRRRFPRVPVVLASGYSDVLARDAAHGFELLHKPYSMEGLSRVLRRAVAGG